MALVGYLLLMLTLTGCSSSPQPHLSNHTLEYSRTLDLSHIITQDMPVLPNQHAPSLDRAAPDGHIQSLQIDVDSGTHLTLISSHLDKNHTVEQLSPSQLIVPTVVFDVRDAAQDNPEFQLRSEDILSWEQRHGTIPAGCIVLLATGWDLRWSSPADYLNVQRDGLPQVPMFGQSALALLLNERQVSGVGIDTPSIGVQERAVGDWNQQQQAQWVVLENLTNLEQMPPFGATLVIGILKIQASRTSPASVIALLP
jgi:kynurenine formamidase